MSVKREVKKPDEYINEARTYKITANTVTIKRFGPSGSFNNQKNVLESINDEIPKIIFGVYFELNMLVIVLEKTNSETC